MDTRRLSDEYGPRALALLGRVGDALRARGHRVEGPEDCSGDEYRWSLTAGRGDKVDVTVKLCESDMYEGSDEGVSWALDVVSHGGEVLGGLWPYNFTPECWVPLGDPGAVRERFGLVDSVDVEAVVEAVERGLPVAG